MILNGLFCNKCKAVIYSRTRHDFHWCPCENVAIDGGGDYIKITFQEPNSYKVIPVEVQATPEDLANDWNLGLDKFGTILPKED